MVKGSDATVQTYNQALKTLGVHVVAITHAGPDPKGGPGGIELSNGISSGSWRSDSSDRKGNTLNVESPLSFDISAKEVAIFGGDSQVLVSQYGDASFIGVDPEQSGGISTALGSAQAADFLLSGGGQAGGYGSHNRRRRSQ